MKKILIILVIVLLQVSCQAQVKKGVELVPPAAFLQKMEAAKGHIEVIDVRTPKEYQSGYINNAVNMHVYDKDFEQRVDKIDKENTVFIYCKAGGRSAEAVEILKEKGFNHIVELEGGMDAWTEAGKPVKH
jgi:phage shock protein E